MVNFIICELNPPHAGHKYLLSHIPEGEKVVILSGHMTQRGTLPFTDKWTRAEMALAIGADLVIELPAPFAGNCAEVFAKGGVEIARGTGLCGRFCFGLEEDITDRLVTLAAIREQELSPIIKQKQKEGLSYAAARLEALCAIEPQARELLATPNNLLAFEYIRAGGEDFAYYGVPRAGVCHDSAQPVGQFASASFIRSHPEKYEKYTPKKLHPYYKKIISEGAFPDTEKEQLILLHSLRGLTAEQWEQIAPNGIGRRFYRELQKATDIESLLAAVKTKCCTLAGLRRTVQKAVLGIPTADSVPYLRVLAANIKGRALLSEMKPTLPVITKPAEAKAMGKAVREMMEFEDRLTNHFMFLLKQGRERDLEYRTSPVIIL